MEKQPLTPTGVSEFVSQLYALPDVFVAAEAEQVAADFRLWLAGRFELTPRQQDFITHGLDAAFIDFVQARIPFAFLNRLPVSYTVMGQAPDEEEEEEWGKIIEGIENTSQTSSRQAPASGASGTFQFVARYYRKEQ